MPLNTPIKQFNPDAAVDFIQPVLQQAQGNIIYGVAGIQTGVAIRGCREL